jgi:hypothetical protein
MGEHVKNGQRIGSPFGGHGDHIHLALAQGGMYGPYGVLDSFKDGTNWVPRTGPYELHRGEAVVDRATNMAGGGDSDIKVHVTFDGLPVELQKLVRVEIEQDGRRTNASYQAGWRP